MIINKIEIIETVWDDDKLHAAYRIVENGLIKAEFRCSRLTVDELMNPIKTMFIKKVS